MQNFDPNLLAREDELGARFNFTDVVIPASRLIALYRRISLNSLDDFSSGHLQQIKNQADADYNRFQNILDYDPGIQNHVQVRDNYSKAVDQAYDGAFNSLQKHISYGASVAVDFQRMENQARTVIQAIRDQSNDITDELQSSKEQAAQILADVRKVAAEQGVSQQAIYFGEESDSHSKRAQDWRKRTTVYATLLALYAISSVFIHKIPFLTPESSLEAAQLITSKILVFAVLSYLLYLAARNFLSHKHNAIIRAHGQMASSLDSAHASQRMMHAMCTNEA
ncbi:MAG: hypothetical protein RhofKO_10240 [Rhodothermales bacterium]